MFTASDNHINKRLFTFSHNFGHNLDGNVAWLTSLLARNQLNVHSAKKKHVLYLSILYLPADI